MFTSVNFSFGLCRNHCHFRLAMWKIRVKKKEETRQTTLGTWERLISLIFHHPQHRREGINAMNHKLNENICARMYVCACIYRWLQKPLASYCGQMTSLLPLSPSHLPGNILIYRDFYQFLIKEQGNAHALSVVG